MDDGKLPVPEPSSVFVVNEVVGAEFTDHTTPREVTADPPSDVIFPPPIAVKPVILPIVVVVTEGIVIICDMVVLNVLSSPYPVPALFVAYAFT